MLTKDQNETLCRVGPGSPMGEVLRRYWCPAFLLADLPERDCAPIGVTVLGQDFVAFRDSSGQLGFLDELCCHRGAPLSYGRVEEGGIRCLYHGWKYSTDGTILEAPNCENPYLLERVRQGSYPVREAGGLGWVYLGPQEFEPPFPQFPWMDSDDVTASEIVFDCNWLQVQEGSLDSSHLGIVHMDGGVVIRPLPRRVGSLEIGGIPWDDVRRPYAAGMPTDDNAPVIEVEDTPFGFHYAAIRQTSDPEKRYVRITAFALPYSAHITSTNSAVIVVPRDDETCSTFNARSAATALRPPGPTETQLASSEVREVRFPSDARRYRLPGQNRAAMATRSSFAGFPDGRAQDASVQGVNAKRRTYTRATEHLVAADAAILRLRRLLLESLERVQAGQPPLGLGEGYDYSQMRAASAVMDPDQRWQDLVSENLGRPVGGAALAPRVKVS
jgi:phthalate 4,5-dioxygenase oxygenase subunit